jgi:hypothetical protein
MVVLIAIDLAAVVAAVAAAGFDIPDAAYASSD